METDIAFAKLPMPRDLKSADDFYESVVLPRLMKPHGYYMSVTFLPDMPSVLIREAESFAFTRLASSAIAVERFRLANGQLPESLKALTPRFLSTVPIDPFDGANLRYRRLPAGYLIYSVDRDRHDDGGQERPDYMNDTETNSYDITLTVER